ECPTGEEFGGDGDAELPGLGVTRDNRPGHRATTPNDTAAGPAARGIPGEKISRFPSNLKAELPERPITENGAAAHHPRHVGLVETGGAVQRAAIVPHHALARCPMMRVDALGWRDHLIELFDQRAALGVVHALDIFGVVAEEDRFAPGVGMRAL